MYVTEGRPTEGYPLSGNRGEILFLSKNVGSGWISSTQSMSDNGYVCVDCGDEWSVDCDKGVYQCPGFRCAGRWRAINEEDRKCPECDSDPREVVM